MDTIYGIVRKEIDGFIYDYIEPVEGYSFNQYQTIKRIHLYSTSTFENQQLYHNRERIFFNIVNAPVDILTKFLNIDTKDLVLDPMNPESDIATLIADKEFKYQLKHRKFAFTLNELAAESSTNGSVVIKKLKKGDEIMDLRYLFLDQAVSSIKKSRFVTQKHLMTAAELREMKGVWNADEIESLIEKHGAYYNESSYEKDGRINTNLSSPYFEIYERYGEVPRYMLDDSDSEEMVRAMFIVAEPYKQSENENGAKHDEGFVLFKSKWNKDWPFKDYHIKRIKGRWLGLGPVELLFPAQERMNEIANQKRISMEASAIHVYQSATETSIANINTAAVNGEIIVNNGNPIVPVANEERNFGAFQIESREWMQLANDLTFASDAARGDALPSSTPATNAAIQDNNIKSIYGFKRENFCEFVREYLNDDMMEEVISDLTPEHMLSFVGGSEELEKFDKIVIEPTSINHALNEVLEGNKAVYAEDVDKMKSDLLKKLKANGSRRFMKIKDKFYKDYEFKYDFLVGNEQEDVATMANNLFSFLTALAQNPALIDDPFMKVFTYKYAQKIGIDSGQLELASAKREDMKQMHASQQPVVSDEAEQSAIPSNIAVNGRNNQQVLPR